MKANNFPIIFFALILVAQGFFLIIKDPLSNAAISRIDPTVFNTQKIVDPGVPPAIPTKYLYHLPNKGNEPVPPPGGAGGAVAVVNKDAIDRPPAIAGDLNTPASANEPVILEQVPKTGSAVAANIGGVEAKPFNQGETSFYFDILNAVIALEDDPKFNLSPSQARALLDLMKNMEGAKDIAKKTETNIKQVLNAQQLKFLAKQENSSSDQTLESLMHEVLTQLKNR
jgi:hypothetical protein